MINYRTGSSFVGRFRGDVAAAADIFAYARPTQSLDIAHRAVARSTIVRDVHFPRHCRSFHSGRPVGTAAVARAIILDIRLPRIVTGMLAGMQFALAGLVLQTTTRNPLAAPSPMRVS